MWGGYGGVILRGVYWGVCGAPLWALWALSFEHSNGKPFMGGRFPSLTPSLHILCPPPHFRVPGMGRGSPQRCWRRLWGCWFITSPSAPKAAFRRRPPPSSRPPPNLWGGRWDPTEHPWGGDPKIWGCSSPHPPTLYSPIKIGRPMDVWCRCGGGQRLGWGWGPLPYE